MRDRRYKRAMVISGERGMVPIKIGENWEIREKLDLGISPC